MLDGDLAWELATTLHFEWEERERELLAKLVDATIMRVEGRRLDEIALPLAEALWDELRPLVSDELVDQAQRSEFVAEALDDALADLELGPVASRLGVCVLQQAAVDLAEHAFFLEDCLDCLEDRLADAPPHRHRALVAHAAAALALHAEPRFGEARPDAEARRLVRDRIRSLAALGRESLPRLARGLEHLAAEPLPPLVEDGVLQAVVQRRLAASAPLN